MTLFMLVSTFSWAEMILSALVLLGGAFCLIAAIGLLRFDDVFMRLHASTKAGTLGVGLIMVAAAINFQATDAVARALGALIFLLLTAPVAGHMIARAAYASGATLSPRTVVDERAAPAAKDIAVAAE